MKLYFFQIYKYLNNFISGNGIQLVSNGNLGQGGSNLGNLLVPGTGKNSTTRAAANIFVLFIALFNILKITWFLKN